MIIMPVSSPCAPASGCIVKAAMPHDLAQQQVHLVEHRQGALGQHLPAGKLRQQRVQVREARVGARFAR